MKRIVLILILLGTNVAHADYLPPGCYVADSYRTDDCWGEDLSYVSWPDSNFSDLRSEISYYGNAVSTLIQQETLYRLNYTKVANDLKKQKDLAKKLKKKCGSACRGVR
jgi:hypothetical protein